jgi:hypothetical protein
MVSLADRRHTARRRLFSAIRPSAAGLGIGLPQAWFSHTASQPVEMLNRLGHRKDALSE